MTYRDTTWKAMDMGSEGWSVFAGPRMLASHLKEVDARLIEQASPMLEALEQAYDNLSWHPDDSKEALIGYIKDVQERLQQAIRSVKKE
ncbi:hypothetical protein ES705_36793 [subsurface metagenome]